MELAETGTPGSDNQVRCIPPNQNDRNNLANELPPKSLGDHMHTNELSTCFCTERIDQCRAFYLEHFSSTLEFDCGWYISLRIGGDGPSIQFMAPQEDLPQYQNNGVVLNFKVDDVDAEYQRLVEAGLEIVVPLEDHPWGDRGFSISDPIGVSLYIYSDREPSKEFKQYYLA